MATNRHNIYRVLIVDDEPAVRTMLAELLAAPNRSVEVRDTPRAALEFLRHNPIDLAVLDMVMPGMNGVELAKKIKAKCPHAHIVMCTGFAAEATAASATTNAVEQIFEKPFNLGELLEIAEAHTSEAA